MVTELLGQLRLARLGLILWQLMPAWLIAFFPVQNILRKLILDGMAKMRQSVLTLMVVEIS